MKLQKVKGSTSVILQVFIRDSSSTTGAGLTGLTQASSGLTCYYHRDTDTTATAVTLVTMTVGTFTSSGFKEIDSTNMPGWYQLCLPNAAYATGASSVGAHLKGATNMAPLPLEIELTATDNQDAVRMGLTALPNAAAEAAGGLYTRGTGAGQINQDANGRIDANVKTINAVATTSVTTINANVGTTQPINFTGTGASALVKGDAVDIAGAAVSTSTAQLGVNVVNFGGSAGTFSSGRPEVNLSTTAIAAIWDRLTSALTTVGSIGKLLVDNIDAAISSRLASASYTAPLDAAGTRTAVGLASANLDTQLSTIAGYVDTEVAAIKAKTDNLPASPAATGDIPSAATIASQVRTELTTELGRIDAAVSTRATPAQVNTEVVDALNVDTYAEPGQGAPAATTTLAAKINYLYKAWRNKKTQTSSTFSLFADDATTVDQKATVSDDTTTTTVGEVTSGP